MKKNKKANKREIPANKKLSIRFSKAVIKYRKLLGLTQDDTAELSGVDLPTLKRIEGEAELSNPELFTIGPLISTLKINPYEVFFPEKPARNPDLYRLLNYIFTNCSNADAKLIEPSVKTLVEMAHSRNMKDVQK